MEKEKLNEKRERERGTGEETGAKRRRASGTQRERENRPQRADAGSAGSPRWQNESFMPRALAFTASTALRFFSRPDQPVNN